MRLQAILCAVIVALTLAVFLQAANHQFLYFDDPQYVTENPRVRGGLTIENALWAFTATYFSNWHPLTWLSHMLDVELFGLDPRAHHLVNVLLHTTNAVLLFLVLTRLTGAVWRSVFVAALFALHPLHVESVAWVSERKDLISTLFGFLMLWAYWRYALRPGAGRYAAVAAFFVLSLLCKPMWVTAPFLLLLLDLWPLRRLKGFRLNAAPESPPAPQSSLTRLLIEKVPLLLLSAASSAIAIVAQERGGALNSLDRLDLGARVGNALVSYALYLAKTFWPAGLAAYYPLADGGPASWQAAGAGLLLASITALALWRMRAMPWFAVGWFWFLGTLVPVIGLVQVGSQAMADRYTYLPLTGVFIAVAWGLERFGRGRDWIQVPLKVGGVVIIAALSVVTFRQIGYWQDHETLFRHAIAVTVNNGRAHHILSQGLTVNGKLDEALSHARESVRLDPNNPRAHKNLGYILYRLGRLDEAIAAFQHAIALQPDYAEAHGNLAIAYGKKGLTELAIQEMRIERSLRTANPAQ